MRDFVLLKVRRGIRGDCVSFLLLKCWSKRAERLAIGAWTIRNRLAEYAVCVGSERALQTGNVCRHGRSGHGLGLSRRQRAKPPNQWPLVIIHPSQPPLKRSSSLTPLPPLSLGPIYNNTEIAFPQQQQTLLFIFLHIFLFPFFLKKQKPKNTNAGKKKATLVLTAVFERFFSVARHTALCIVSYRDGFATEPTAGTRRFTHCAKGRERTDLTYGSLTVTVKRKRLHQPFFCIFQSLRYITSLLFATLPPAKSHKAVF